MSKTTSSYARWAQWALGAVSILIVTPAAGRAAAEEAAGNKVDQWQVGSAPSFSSGKYGTDTRTEVLQTPVIARRLFGRGDLTAVFPFTCIRGNGNVTVVNGTPARLLRLANAAATNRGATASTSASTNTCGMGDIVVRGRFYLVDEHGWLPTVALRAHVKAPTASVERGLGTGEPDEGAGVEVSRTFVSRTTLMVDGGYTVIGKPAGVDYLNNWWYDVGIAQDVVKAVNLSVFFEEYRAIVPGLENARDVLATLSVKGASGWRLQVSGTFGLSDGAPDHGLTLGASRRF